LKKFLARNDVGIVLITQTLAQKVRHVIDAWTAPIPTIMEIPSKDNPYNPDKDPILQRAKLVFLFILI
jgi:V-type H+-transporting ATPase subunit F